MQTSPPPMVEPGPLADPVPSSSGKKRKGTGQDGAGRGQDGAGRGQGKEEVSGGGRITTPAVLYNTRGWMKNGLDGAQSQVDPPSSSLLSLQVLEGP